MAGSALRPYVMPKRNPALAGGAQKDIAQKAAMGADDAAGRVESGSTAIPEPLENHSVVVGRNGSLRATDTPNTSVDLYSEDGRLLERRFYG